MQKSHLPGELIREIRKRKGFRQSYMQELGLHSSDSQVTLSRIENLRQNPSKLTLVDLLAKVELPYRQFFCPYMEHQPAESFVLRHQIAYLLDCAEGDEAVQTAARERIDLLKRNLDFNSLINKQLWLSLKTELDVICGHGDEELLRLIRSGIQLTYPEFDEGSFHGDVLIFYECDLMLNLARCYANMGDIASALGILARIRDGYEKQPLSEMYKEILLSRMQNLTVRLLLDKGDYAEALTASEAAMSVAKKQSGSSQLPDTVYLRAMALFYATGDKAQSTALLRQAYFAFALLGKSEMARRVLSDARDVIGAEFDRYHTETISCKLPADFFEFKSGGALAVDNIGALLRQFRLAAGAKQSDVYTGICSRSFYSRIEHNERTGVSFFILEALMQRLGRDIDRYIEYFSSVAEWDESRLRMRYMRELYIGNVDEAQETLNALMAVGDFTGGLDRQFLLFSQAIMKGAREDFSDYTALLYEAIKLTIPQFSEDTIADTRLTFNECNILNAIANFYAEHGQVARGIAIYLGIKDSMDKFYVDDSIKARYYLTLLSNLTLEHYNIGQYERGLAFADESEGICRRHGVLFILNSVAQRKALCLHRLGRRDEALAYAAMAYYSGSLTASEYDMNDIEAFAREELGVAFSRELGFVFHQERAGTYANPPQQD